ALPPYIIFSDKTLIDMCVKVPQNKEQMLNISGVGVAKYEKYGNRFLDEILSFKAIHPNAVISIKEDEQGEIDIKHRTEKKSKRKRDFYLEESDASNFKYTKLYYISEIKEELNRVCTVKNAKKVTNAVIWEFLVSEGYTREENKSGVFIKTQTFKGLEAGIKTIEKTSPGGKKYTLLLYPDNIQKLIVEHFVQIKEFILEMKDNVEDVVYGSTLTHTNNRLERAGSAWTDEEDERVKQEFIAGVSIKDIALLHNRTTGAIRSRLKKHKLIEWD
ncbi:MAG: HRDC domain-containing protein, partial [Lachnospiraceae bacterium]|nr:HRDC domain-containing protein [Lachnospiraceae bacterium]